MMYATSFLIHENFSIQLCRDLATMDVVCIDEKLCTYAHSIRTERWVALILKDEGIDGLLTRTLIACGPCAAAGATA